jgi:hypothetical protein
MTISLTLNQLFYSMMKKFVDIDMIESAELLDILKVDLQKGYKIILVKMKMKPGHTIKDLVDSGSVDILSRVAEDEESITCLMKGNPPMHLFSKIGPITEKFNANVIWDVPSRMNGRTVVLSAIGDEEDLNRIAKACKLLGSIDQISFSKTFLQGIDMLQCLTDKQKEIIIKAKQQGYYEYPRKISSDHLSQQIGLSKTTTIEHLRKAENRLMSEILMGY